MNKKHLVKLTSGVEYNLLSWVKNNYPDYLKSNSVETGKAIVGSLKFIKKEYETKFVYFAPGSIISNINEIKNDGRNSNSGLRALSNRTYKKHDKRKKKNSGFIKIDKDRFYSDWFSKQTEPHICVYCGLTDEESELLMRGRLHASRGYKRGFRLELDKKNSELDYDILENLVLACYWCNNAKTNYFTYDEFKLIGPAIGRINKELVRKIKLRNKIEDN